MKLFIALAFFMSSLLGTSSACAHAMGLNSAHSPVVHSNTEIAHSEHSHAVFLDHHDDHNSASTLHNMHSDTHEDCPEDCNGGPDCAGCSAIPASVTIEGFSFTPPVITASYSMSDEAGFDKTFALEPPPPRST